MNKSQKDLVKALISKGVIKNQNVASIMQQVDRKFYAPYSCYVDSPQVIGYSATISAPHMHAYALEYLYDRLKTAKYTLDVGSGTGYLTAAMALIVPEGSKVYGIEHVPQLVDQSIQNIFKSNPELLKEKIQIRQGDGRLGWVHDETIQFDVIHVGAAASKVPSKLIDRLAEGGKMVIPVGGQHQTQKFLQISKEEGKVQQKLICLVNYVPLTDLKRQLSQ